MSNICTACGDSGVKYKCKTCDDVSLCILCYNDPNKHSFQHIMDPIDLVGSGSNNNMYYFDDDDNVEECDDDEDEEDDQYDNYRGGEYDDDDESCDDDDNDDDDDGEIDFKELEEIDATFSRLFSTALKYNSQINNSSYKCPYCNASHTEATLPDHILTSHKHETRSAVCPICASRPDGNPNYVSRNLVGHMGLRHKNVPNNSIKNIQDELSSRNDFLASLFGVNAESLSSIIKQKEAAASSKSPSKSGFGLSPSSSSSKGEDLLFKLASSATSKQQNDLGSQCILPSTSSLSSTSSPLSQILEQSSKHVSTIGGLTNSILNSSSFSSFLAGNGGGEISSSKSTLFGGSLNSGSDTLNSNSSTTMKDSNNISNNNNKDNINSNNSNSLTNDKPNQQQLNQQNQPTIKSPLKIEKIQLSELNQPIALSAKELEDQHKNNILKSIFVQDLLYSTIFDI